MNPARWWPLAGLCAAGVLAACSDPAASRLDPAAARGRQVYLAQCTACHATDPAQGGPLGPAVKGSSQALLEARILRGGYPPGYRPKRPTSVMQPMPQLASQIADLAAYLR
jgi:mono/diheme cytochrome c family protein